jgi:geranylgeranyl diphosphate synthase type II
MLKEALKVRKDAFEKVLYDRYSHPSTFEKAIFEAMQYSLEAGGKRLRPILLMEACRLCGGQMKDAEPYGIAIEMIHTYSLIHDDLPAMDNDDYRRGKLTNHKVFGEGMAVLAGDGLLNASTEVMLEAIIASGMKANRIMAMQDVVTAAGVKGMIGGQVVDLLSENADITYETLEFIHQHKTGALITAALTSGVRVADGSEAEYKALKRYGECIGLTFQIIDDILDLVGDADKLGKPIGSDLENQKSTYPKFFGLEGSKQKAKELTQEALASLEIFGEDSLFLKELALDMLRRDF